MIGKCEKWFAPLYISTLVAHLTFRILFTTISYFLNAIEFVCNVEMSAFENIFQICFGCNSLNRYHIFLKRLVIAATFPKCFCWVLSFAAYKPCDLFSGSNHVFLIVNHHLSLFCTLCFQSIEMLNAIHHKPCKAKGFTRTLYVWCFYS